MRSVAEVMSNWWLAFIVPLVLVAIVVALGKVFISNRKMEAFWGLVVLVLVIVIVPQVWVWIAGDAPRTEKGCTPSSPCELRVKSDGFTETVRVPVGRNICFEPTFWIDLPKLGYRTSYRGGEEKVYGCTRETVLAGTCREVFGDAFRFKPEKGTLLPRYWFISESGNC